jgi:hypothetical protein
VEKEEVVSDHDTCIPLAGVDIHGAFALISTLSGGRVLATLDDELIDRIAERVVELLLERNQRGEGRR